MPRPNTIPYLRYTLPRFNLLPLLPFQRLIKDRTK